MGACEREAGRWESEMCEQKQKPDTDLQSLSCLVGGGGTS